MFPIYAVGMVLLTSYSAYLYFFEDEIPFSLDTGFESGSRCARGPEEAGGRAQRSAPSVERLMEDGRSTNQDLP